MTIPAGRAILHGGAVAVMAYGWISLNNNPVMDFIANQKGGHLQFLTIQGLAIAATTMLCSLLSDLAPKNKALKTIKRPLMITSFLVCVVVTTIYWSLMVFFPTLILKEADPEPSSSSSLPDFIRIPLETDLALHAAPCFSLFVDFFMFEAKYTDYEVSIVAPVATVLYTISYTLWTEYCASYNHIYPYPFLNNPLPIRLVIYVSAGLLGLASFRGLNSLHPGRSVAT